MGYEKIMQRLSETQRSALNDVRELESLYLILRAELDRRVEAEAASGRYDPTAGRLMLLASDALTLRASLRAALGHGTFLEAEEDREHADLA